MSTYSPELDEAVRSTLRLVDGYLVLQREAELDLKPGWMNLASARYNLGPGSLTSASYPAVMEALSVIDIRASSSSSSSSSPTTSPSPALPIFELRTRKPDSLSVHRPALAASTDAPGASGDEAEYEGEGAEEEGADAPAIRKSQEDDLQSLLQQFQLKGLEDAPEEGTAGTTGKGGGGAGAGKNGGGRPKEIELQRRSIPAEASSAKEESTASVAPEASSQTQGKGSGQARSGPEQRRKGLRFDPRSDPVHWFGYLVPPSLKQAKGSFQSALPKICQAAALRARIVQEMGRVQAIRQKLAESG